MLQEILSGIKRVHISCGNEIVRVENFSPDQKAEAESFASEVAKDAKSWGCYTEMELVNLRERLGIWTAEDEVKYKTDLDTICSLKVTYLDNFFLPSKDQVKKRIISALSTIDLSFTRKSEFWPLSCESIKQDSYFNHLFSSHKDPQGLSTAYRLSIRSESDIRSLRAKYAWSTIWGVCKSPFEIFGQSLNWLNPDQLSLTYWSKVYDSIHEAMEPPPSAILDDDIAVDGWFIKQNRKKQAEEKINILPNIKGGEVFLPVRNIKEQAAILDLNSSESKSVIKSRTRDMLRSTSLDEQDFSDVKRDRAMEQNKRK